ncbi:hypothetical protein J3R82DRAFT_1479 [Butyriboletus roseoflavus]|nr:hypothetical protein J3R82DRAFT_1479 [Butyriboletus roseoflavus]
MLRDDDRKAQGCFLARRGSGTERLELMLADGRGCIKFIRILLGLALVDKVNLGRYPDLVLKGKNKPARPKTSVATSEATSRWTKKGQAYSVPTPLSRVTASLASSRPRSTSAAVCQCTIVSSKRVHSEIADDGDEGTQSKTAGLTRTPSSK